MSVYGYVALSVFIGIQGSRVDVDIRVELLDGYAVASACSNLPIDDEMIPFPNEEATPPVTKIYFVSATI